MVYSKKNILLIFSILIILCIGSYYRIAYAETSQSEIVTLDSEQDLVVMFTFETEVVDIVFISPSGERKDSGDSDVEYNSGDLWSSYRISDAEAGTWSVEYDLKGNSEINYSIIDDNFGLWIQYVDVANITENSATIQFEADSDSYDYYQYELYAVNMADDTLTSMLADGHAGSNKEIEIEVSLEYLASGSYTFYLEVHSTEAGAEVFDRMSSDETEYNNPNAESAIEDFVVLVDIGNSTCSVDWTDYANTNNEYYLCIYSDDELSYSADFDEDNTYSQALISSSADEIKVVLYCKDNNIWTTPKEKTINLQEEYLKILSDEITSTGQVELEYLTTSGRELQVVINEDEGIYNLTGDGSVSFELTEGANTVYAKMECDDLISYIVDTEVYYDANPPEIKLYDSLDGKTFYTDTVDIIGKVSGCNKLIICGEEVTVDDNGEFSYVADLILGENVVDIEAEDANGNAARMTLTLYKASEIISVEEAKTDIIQFLPLAITLFVSLIIIILACIFMRKTNKVNNMYYGKKYRIWPLIICDVVILLAEAVCIWQFIIHYIFCNSIEFLEMAESSVTEAAEYLKLEKILGIASCVGAALLIAAIVITVVYRIVTNKKKANMNNYTNPYNYY